MKFIFWSSKEQICLTLLWDLRWGMFFFVRRFKDQSFVRCKQMKKVNINNCDNNSLCLRENFYTRSLFILISLRWMHRTSRYSESRYVCNAYKNWQQRWRRCNADTRTSLFHRPESHSHGHASRVGHSIQGGYGGSVMSAWMREKKERERERDTRSWNRTHWFLYLSTFLSPFSFFAISFFFCNFSIKCFCRYLRVLLLLYIICSFISVITNNNFLYNIDLLFKIICFSRHSPVLLCSD